MACALKRRLSIIEHFLIRPTRCINICKSNDEAKTVCKLTTIKNRTHGENIELCKSDPHEFRIDERKSFTRSMCLSIYQRRHFLYFLEDQNGSLASKNSINRKRIRISPKSWDSVVKDEVVRVISPANNQ